MNWRINAAAPVVHLLRLFFLETRVGFWIFWGFFPWIFQWEGDLHNIEVIFKLLFYMESKLSIQLMHL